MDLYVVRHGKAENRSSNVNSDSKRKLTETGISEMHIISKSLGMLEVKLDYLASSPLKRSIQTSEIISKHLLSKKQKIEIWNELKPEINVSETINKMKTLKPNSSLMLVGHEPHLSTLIANLISVDPDNVDITLKKGGFAHIRISSMTHRPVGTLRSLLTPKQLKKLCN